MFARALTIGIAALAATTIVGAQGQGQRPASPEGTAATQVGGKWVKDQRGESYQGGKWVEVTYGRPILKQRTNIFGAGAEYGKTLNAGAPVWRAGANASTRLRSEVPLQIGGKMVPAGEYSLFIDLKENNWTLIVSSWPAQKTYDQNNKAELWGSSGYTPDKDVARVQMTVGKLPFSADQLTWSFIDMTPTGGKLAIMWDNVIAAAPFTVAQ